MKVGDRVELVSATREIVPKPGARGTVIGELEGVPLVEFDECFTPDFIYTKTWYLNREGQANEDPANYRIIEKEPKMGFRVRSDCHSIGDYGAQAVLEFSDTYRVYFFVVHAGDRLFPVEFPTFEEAFREYGRYVRRLFTEEIGSA